MGLDIYIKAKITEKATGRCISICDKSYCRNGSNFKYRTEDNDWFTVLWMCSWSAVPLLNSWIDIVNRYMKTSYTYEDNCIPFQQSALREMCSCLLSYACTPESNRFKWDIECGFWDIKQREKENNIPYSTEKLFNYIEWDAMESMEYVHLYWGKRLRDFIYFLERINYENKYIPLKADNDGLNENGNLIFVNDFIGEKSDLKKFKENPQDYEWSFKIFNSY